MSEKKIDWINYCKGELIILVVLGHAISGMKFVEAQSILWSAIYKIITTFHMALFFIISGWLYNKKNKYNTLQKYWLNSKNKICDLLVPYFVFTFIYAVIGFITHNEKYTFNSVLMSIYTPVSHFWFLYVLFGIFIIAPLLLFVVKKERTALLGVIILNIVVDLCVGDAELTFPIDKIIYYMFFFILGKWADKEGISIDKMLDRWWKLFLIAGLYVVLLAVNVKYKRNLYVERSIVAVLASTIFIKCIPQFRKKTNGASTALRKFLYFLGDETLLIYLIHSLCISFTRTILMKTFMSGNSAVILISTIIGVLVPAILAYIGRKIWIISIWYYPRKNLQRLCRGIAKSGKK